jgi:predicted RecB family endonuclease
VGRSWRLDETYVKIKGQWAYLYRAVDKEGQTIDFLLSPTRDRDAAEVDLVLDRGSERFAVEIKAGRGDKGQVVRALEQAKLDIEASAAWVVDQADGVDPLRPGIERRGFKESAEWLPQ